MLAVQTNSSKITTATSDEKIMLLWLTQESAATQDLYRSTVKQFLHFLENKAIAQISLDDLFEWVRSISELAQNTQRNKIATIKSLFSFSTKIGYITVNPSLMLKQPKEQDTLTERILSKLSVKAIAADCPAYCDEMIIKTLHTLGVRVS